MQLDTNFDHIEGGEAIKQFIAVNLHLPSKGGSRSTANNCVGE